MNIVIIGNGITGITCARNIRKMDSDVQIIVISAESEHFYSRTALMYIYMGQMKFEHTKPYEDWFWDKNRITLVKAVVNELEHEKRSIRLDNGKIIPYDTLIIASGSIPNRFGWPGEDLKGVQGLYSIQDLEEMENNTRGVLSAVVVGGGLIGIEMAEMLHSRKIQVTMLVREKAYWGNILPREEAELIGRHIREHGINLKTNSELSEILPDERGGVKAVLTQKKENIECQFVGITAGVRPNIKFLKNSPLKTDRGILVNEYFETSIPHIYAAGDCAQFRNPNSGSPSVEQLWYTGKMQAETLAKTICRNKTAYDRGIWFNSAKFFDIEYQTYGQVPPETNDQQASFYWEHPKGKMAFRATFNKADRSLLGLNFLGLRFRQMIAEDWIRNHETIEFVMKHLNKGWFDPEFSKPYFKEIALAFSASQNEVTFPISIRN